MNHIPKENGKTRAHQSQGGLTQRNKARAARGGEAQPINFKGTLGPYEGLAQKRGDCYKKKGDHLVGNLLL